MEITKQAVQRVAAKYVARLVDPPNEKYVKQLDGWLKDLESHIKDARQSTKRGQVSNAVSRMLGFLNGYTREDWYGHFFR